MQRLSTPNKVQVKIVKSLFLSDGQRFAELNTTELTNDHFSYHIRKLVEAGYIYKSEDGRYYLTTEGKSSAILLDSNEEKYINQGFVACRVVISRENNGQTEYLLQRRTKVPFKGYLAEPGGKILWGESVIGAARRNIFEQTGLHCDFEIKGQIHIRDLYDNEIVQDKYFFVLTASVISGVATEKGPTGTNHWMTTEEIYADPKAHKGIATIRKIASSKHFMFVEESHTTEEY